ncbi:MAG: biotin--[acetyl-CoA-carboxylase] ligase [Candidatus Latescibacteria bacterium]|nr:biotin--[acetyl-CoA-carboxylase] ligase [Candidatus Latescibacterota bacterium]
MSAGPLTQVALQGLQTRCFGQRVFSFAEVGSTNDELRRLADAGAEEGTLVIAERQTAGRGRRGRVWHSPPDTGLWCSLLLRPPASLVPSLVPLLLGIAIARGIRACCGVPAFLKWPNDVLIAGLKVAGVLCEAGPGGLVAGFGVDVNQEEFPPELPAATSILLQRGRPTDRALLLRAVLEEAERLYLDACARGPAQLIAAATALLSTLGRQVEVQLEGETLRGLACGLEADGALQLEEEGGGQRLIRAGDVQHLDQVEPLDDLTGPL